MLLFSRANRNVDVRRLRAGVVDLGAHRQDRAGAVPIRDALPRDDHHGRAREESQEHARHGGGQGEGTAHGTSYRWM